jgi:hypothetical protein
MQMKRLVVLVAAGLATVLAAGPVLAVVPIAVLVSGPSPFAACTVGGPGTNYVNAEAEPWVSVDPANPQNILAVFQQDRWSNGGAHGLVTSVSHDGGLTWSETWPPLSTCAGGTAGNGGNYDRSSDPWVTFTPTGNAYQISISVSADLFTSSVLVSKSVDAGDTWSNPTTLIRDDSFFHFNDKESITADPTDSSGNRVYAVWDRSRKPGENADFNQLHSFAFRGDVMFSRTSDGGGSWEAPRSILPTNANLFTIGNQVAVLPNGTLIDVFELGRGSGVQQSPNLFTESLLRSTDHGLTWSRVIDISTDQSVAVVDPDTGAPVRVGAGLPDIAVDPNNGTLYAVWADGRFSGGAHDDVAFSSSTDGGLTWSDPVKVNANSAGAAAFTPSVAVSSDGTVGITFYDFRNNTGALGVPTDYWFIGSSNGGTTWSEQHVAGPFDIESAPISRGYFLGDYEGLAAAGTAFHAVYVAANTGNTANPTDVFHATITP